MMSRRRGLEIAALARLVDIAKSPSKHFEGDYERHVFLLNVRLRSWTETIESSWSRFSAERRAFSISISADISFRSKS